MNILKKIKNFFFNEIQTKEYLQFISDGGDELIFKNIILKDNAVTIDGGGFDGEFTDEILKKKCQNIYIYEPDPDFYKNLIRKYQLDNRVKILNLALFDKDRKMNLSENSNASSIMESTDSGRIINTVDVYNEFKKYEKIDLLKLNIEGAEYDVLLRLIEKNELNKVKYLLVQFHKEHDLAEVKYNNILPKITKEFDIIFNYKYVWSLFVKK